MSPQTIQVLIVEDYDHTATRLHRSVSTHPDLQVCAVASDLRTARQHLRSHRPRIILCDLGLPDGSGIDLILEASGAGWTCDSLVISVFGDEDRVLAAIRAGASGYILKNSTGHDICRDILAVINGGSPISPKIARHLLTLVGENIPKNFARESDMLLTPRETEILQAVAKGFRRHEIAQELSISAGTVGNHINNIYKKLEVHSSIDALSRASTMGLL